PHRFRQAPKLVGLRFSDFAGVEQDHDPADAPGHFDVDQLVGVVGGEGMTEHQNAPFLRMLLNSSSKSSSSRSEASTGSRSSVSGVMPSSRHSRVFGETS